MTNRPSPARAAALKLLDAVLIQGKLMSELERTLAPLDPADRAAAQRLALQTLRGLDRADFTLRPHLRKPPPLKARNVLRLAAMELAQGGAAHGVINDAVNALAADRKTQGFKGLANAVLRKAAPEAAERWSRAPVPRLSKWLRGPLVAAWGHKSIATMERLFEAPPPLDLTPRGDTATVAQAVRGEVLPTGSVRVAPGAQVSALAGYDTGGWWVQDAAAALPVRLLGDVRGQSLLDMCAAPGGKTLQLAAAGADVTALDISAHRLQRVRENLDRTGLSAKLVEGDALAHDGSYDAILLDAPCSATGTLRRHPDLHLARDGSGIGDLIGLQAAMLDHALTLLKPGGRLVFCTCSLLPDEGECHIDLISERPGIAMLRPEAEGIEDTWRSEEGGLRIRPDFWAERGGIDGFYMAVLQKHA